MNNILRLLALLCPCLAFATAPAKPLELREGDRVVFLGDTLMEREKDYGYIELMMTLRFPDRNVTFRNLGWSADTPVGISRVSFDWPKGEGEMFRQLMEQVKQVQPTVVVLGYGMASSFDGDAGVEKFTKDYNKLIDAILELNKDTRFLLLSPIRHEKLPPPLPDPARHNEMLAGYTKAIQGIAEKRGCQFVSLFDGLAHAMDSKGPLTENGIHLSGLGYNHLAYTLARGLHWTGFEPRFADYHILREVIIAKNQLFFHRWRPENSTYLFLFRKHEQGRNAQEIPKFDPLIQAEEEKIAKLRRLPPEAPSPGQLARKPSQNPLPDKPATPFKTQPHPTFQLADTNLEVTLWAENPLLAKPIAMNWDARGRLWIASSSVYPQIEPGQAQDDKILILEDTNGDGKADKATVFADGLLIPTGIEPGDGGCYVGQSTELLHFKDTDGDGIADQRRVVLSGFGTEDTHHILHTLRWGPDGQIYMNQSIYIHSHIETPHGVVRLNSGGTLALRPDTMELGVTMKGLVNGWGHVWDDFGQEFQTDGAGGAGINWNIPQAMFVTYEGARRVLGSVSPGAYPKFCGLELIKSERFPKEWQGNAVTLDFRANRMVRFEIIEQGAGYTTRQHEFLRSTNVTFRPIDVKLGPDGALYIADWSNPIIQHGEVDFRDPRRDRVHGRIWRVGYKGGKDVKGAELVKLTNTELLNELSSPNAWTQIQAQRSLVERQRDTNSHLMQDVFQFVAEQMKGNRDDHAKLQLVRLYQALRWFSVPYARSYTTNLLASTDPRIRAAATRVVGAWAGIQPDMPTLSYSGWLYKDGLELLRERVRDQHPRVQIEALRALARVEKERARMEIDRLRRLGGVPDTTCEAAELALSVLDAPSSRGREPAADRSSHETNGRGFTAAATELDPFLEYALWLTINDLAEPWAAAVESGAWKIEGREKQLQYALKAIEPKLATRLMDKVFAGKTIPRDGSGGMIELIGQAGGPAQLRLLFDQALKGGFEDMAMARALNALAEAARLRNARPGGDLSPITSWLGKIDRHWLDVHAAAIRLVGAWKIRTATQTLASLASRPDGFGGKVQLPAIEALREIGGREAITSLRAVAKDTDASVRRAAASALAAADLNGSLPQILEVVSATRSEQESLVLWRSLLAAKGAPAAFANALTKATLPEAVAKAGLRVAREGGRNEPNLVLALNRAGGMANSASALTDEEIHNISYNVTKGDPANGEKIYRNKQLGCVLCHSIGGAGGKVGPDITSLGASSPVVDYIVESVLLPNKRVKEGFNSVQVMTKDDEEIAGNLVRETSEELILRDATAREVSIPKRNIASRKMGGSLMPAGLLDFITPQERLDLYAFLKELGKPGPYDGTKQNVARSWRLNPKVGTVNADEMLKSDIRGRDWTPLFATVGGTLPKSDVMEELAGQDTTVWVASRFQMAKGGVARFNVTGTPSPKAWVDGKPIGGAGELSTALDAGTHTFFLKVTTTDIASGLKLESGDVTFLAE